jgi:hypothetical protein
MQRHHVGLLTIGVLVLLSGCTTATVDTTVSEDATVEEFEMYLNTTSTVYGALEDVMQDEGHDSLEDYVLNGSDPEAVTYSEEWSDEEVSIHVSAEGEYPLSDRYVSVTEEDGQIVYEDRMFYNESSERASEFQELIMSGVTVHYYLTMPGEITDSNADSVDGNTAEWHSTGSEAIRDTRVQATSEKPLLSSVPVSGFGPLVAIIAFVALAVGIRSRSR